MLQFWHKKVEFQKKEQKNINNSLKDIETIMKIGNELLKDEVYLENIRNILEQDENKNWYLYFKTKLNDLEELFMLLY